MTSIPYTFEVLSVGDLSMDVRYSNPTHGEMLVGVRLPYEGEDLESVIDQFSPALYWAEQTKQRQTIPIGLSGSGETFIGLDPTELTQEEMVEMWRDSMIISQLQAHYTLKVWGLYDQVVDLVNMVGDPLKLAFERAVEWRRGSLAIQAMFANITMPDGTTPTPELVDQFFIEATGFSV
jgi:hypothetical protein